MIFDDDNQLEQEFFYGYFLPMIEASGEKCIFFHCTCEDSLYNYIQKQKDIDVITDNGSRNISYSLKTVRQRYSKIFIETISNMTKNTPGWGIYSEAQYIVYTMGFPDDVLSYRFSSVAMKELILDGYHRGYGETRTRDGRLLYKTEGALVPPNDIRGLVTKQLGDR